jgi:hypothetical protein
MRQTFSQSQGIEPINEVIQIGTMNERLRVAIWNALDRTIWSRFSKESSYHVGTQTKITCRWIWEKQFDLAMDELPDNLPHIMKFIKKRYFDMPWNKAYEFMDNLAFYLFDPDAVHYQIYNQTLEEQQSGYRFVNGCLTNITSQEELKMLEEAVSDNEFKPASNHLKRALELYSDLDNPDYKNSMKESISAVESIVKIITNKPKADLGDALKLLVNEGKLHPALSKGFDKLYGYTSDAGGIRHCEIGDSEEITEADARYFLVSCSCFVNYLKTKI